MMHNVVCYHWGNMGNSSNYHFLMPNCDVKGMCIRHDACCMYIFVCVATGVGCI